MFVFNILGSAAVNNEALLTLTLTCSLTHKQQNIKVHKCFNVKFKRLSLSFFLFILSVFHPYKKRRDKSLPALRQVPSSVASSAPSSSSASSLASSTSSASAKRTESKSSLATLRRLHRLLNLLSVINLPL